MEEPHVSDKLLLRQDSESRPTADKFSWTTALAIIGLTIVSTAALLSGVLLLLHNQGYLATPHQLCTKENGVNGVTTASSQTSPSQSPDPSTASSQSFTTLSHLAALLSSSSSSSPTTATPSPSPPPSPPPPSSPRGNSCRACAKEGAAKLLATADLRTGNITVTPLGKGVISIQDSIDPTPANQSNCDVRALLSINVPENSIVRFNLVHGPQLAGGATFHVGDSQYNDGWSRDCENHSSTTDISARDGVAYSDDCAEMHSDAANPDAPWIYFYGTLLPGWWHYTTEMYRGERSGGAPWLELAGIPNAVTPSMTLWAGHRYMAANNHANFQVCYDNDMVFLPKQPSRSPNNDIYFGMNRVIRTSLERSASGLCEAALYLIESC